MGFKDKILGSALNDSNTDLDSLQSKIRGVDFDLSKVDPCSDNPFKSSYKDLIKEILKLFVVMLPNIPNLPPSLIYMGNKAKGGLSAIRETAKFLEELKSMGVPIETFEDGTPNFFADSVLAQNEIRNKEFIQNAKVTMATKPGSVNIKGIGASAVGPVDVTGFNTNFFKGEGGIR
jgi:hypothetical protein